METISGHKDPRPRHAASIYRLRIAGVLPEGWIDRLGSLRVIHEDEAGPRTETTLMGAVTDQAELLGVLNTLHELHLPLLLVEAIDVKSIPNRDCTKRKTG